MGIYGKLKKGRNLGRTIADLKVGETGYSVPWAIDFDLDQNPYLDLGMSIHKTPGGTVQLPITRTGDGLEDFDIDIREVKDYEWHPSNRPFSGVVGVESSKIVRLKYEDTSELNKNDIN